jgi:hypothetical protein
VVFNSTCWYIDDVLSISNQFHTYFHSICPNELEINDTTECSTSASYLDISLKLDTNGKLTTQLHDKRNYFNFSIVNLPFWCRNIPISPAYGVYISQLIRYARACSTWGQFLIRGSLCWQKSWCHRSFYAVSFTSSFLQVFWSLQRSSLPIQPFFGPNSVWCVSCQSLSHFWVTDLDYGLNRLPELELGLTADVTGRQGMLTPPKHLIPPLVCPEVRVCSIIGFVFSTGFMRLITVRYLCYFSLNSWSVFSCKCRST